MISYYDSTVRVGRKQRQLKLKLYKKHKAICYYCGTETIIQDRRQQTNHPINMATVEHLYCRFDIRRAISRETVLACHKCNQAKNEEDSKLFKYGFDRSEIIDIRELLKPVNIYAG